MTGAFVLKGGKIPEYKSFKIHSETWPPKFTKLEMEFDNGAVRLAFVDPRRLGRIQLRENAHLVEPISKLALDPYTESEKLSPQYVYEQINRLKTTPIKSALLDQNKVCLVSLLRNLVVTKI